MKFSPLTEVSFFGYDGEVRIVKDEALIAKVRQIMPQIMEMYDKNGWEMGLFYLENGHAEIRGMMELKEEFDVCVEIQVEYKRERLGVRKRN